MLLFEPFIGAVELLFSWSKNSFLWLHRVHNLIIMAVRITDLFFLLMARPGNRDKKYESRGPSIGLLFLSPRRDSTAWRLSGRLLTASK